MYIGLDVGTSGTKAALIDGRGKVLASHQVSYNFSDARQGHRELDAEEMWRAVKICLEAVGAGQEVKMITVSTLGEAVTPIDRAGNPLSGCITGTDIRGTEELEILKDLIGPERLVDITGLNLSTIYSANKILWMKKYTPEIYEKAWKILTVQDYVVYRLCGQPICDYSIASRTCLFDVGTFQWSQEILEKTGICREKLSHPHPSGTVAGEIFSDLKKELGLVGTVRVAAGSHDHICNALGCGVYQEGSSSDTMGTTEGFTAVLRRKQLPSENVEKYQISCEPFVLPQFYNTVAWNNTSGVLLRWFVQEFVKEESPDTIIKTYARLNEEMEKEPTRLLILPHFSGAATPYMDSRSKGAILGLTMDTRRQDIYKALMESVNLELALILECMEAAGLQVNKITATGGALSPQLLQIKADVLGREIGTVENKQTGTLGCAILGSVAAGDYHSLEEAIEAMVRPACSYEPNQERNKIYKDRLDVYKKLYPALAEISRVL